MISNSLPPSLNLADIFTHSSQFPIHKISQVDSFYLVSNNSKELKLIGRKSLTKVDRWKLADCKKVTKTD